MRSAGEQVQHRGDVADAGGDQHDHEGVDLAGAQQQVDDRRQVVGRGAGAGVDRVAGAGGAGDVPGHLRAQAG